MNCVNPNFELLCHFCVTKQSHKVLELLLKLLETQKHTLCTDAHVNLRSYTIQIKFKLTFDILCAKIGLQSKEKKNIKKIKHRNFTYKPKLKYEQSFHCSNHFIVPSPKANRSITQSLLLTNYNQRSFELRLPIIESGHERRSRQTPSVPADGSSLFRSHL